MLNGILSKKKDSVTKHEALVMKARDLGRKLGKAGLPKAEDDSLMPYLAPVTSAYEEMIAPYAPAKARGGERIAGLRRKAAEERKRSLDGKIKSLGEKRRRAEMLLDELPKPEKTSSSAILNALVLGSISIMEGAIAARVVGAFEKGSNAQLAAVFVVLSIIFYGVSKVFVTYFRKAGNFAYGGLVRAGMCAAVIGVFTFMAHARGLFLGTPSLTSIEAPVGQETNLHWTFWIAIQAFLFAISCGLSGMAPSDEDKERARKRDEAQKAVDALEKALQRAEEELERLPLDAVEDEIGFNESSQRDEAERSKVQAMYQQACSAFKEELLLWRADDVPDCVYLPVPPLNFENN